MVIGVGLAGALLLAEVHRRRVKAKSYQEKDYGAFVERFELLPFPQPPPPAARLPLHGLTFAINDKYMITIFFHDSLYLHGFQVLSIDLKLNFMVHFLI